MIKKPFISCPHAHRTSQGESPAHLSEKVRMLKAGIADLTESKHMLH